MNVKIDTKEKFTVITPIEPEITANMTVEFPDLLLSYLNNGIPHIVLNLQAIQYIDEEICKKIAGIQQQFYDNNFSFIICELQELPEAMLDKLQLLELMNITSTESEAWDIVHMEELERELLNDE